MTARPGTAALCALLLATMAMLAGCANNLPLRTVAFQVAPRANNDTPIASDLVLILNKARESQILSLTAAQWFARRDQMLRDYPKDLAVMHFELVPGQTLPARPIVPSGGVVAAVLFSDYQAQGDHRVALANQENAQVILGATDADIKP